MPFAGFPRQHVPRVAVGAFPLIGDGAAGVKDAAAPALGHLNVVAVGRAIVEEDMVLGSVNLVGAVGAQSDPEFNRAFVQMKVVGDGKLQPALRGQAQSRSPFAYTRTAPPTE